jgi:redox-sensing transcriptional repressor
VADDKRERDAPDERPDREPEAPKGPPHREDSAPDSAPSAPDATYTTRIARGPGGVGVGAVGEPEAEPAVTPEPGVAGVERLSLGVAARLSRYLQVLSQAKKMGKETISSRELSEYTHVNSTQIRRDFSGFGKFGKRGVGYNVDALVSQIRKILRTSGQHNIALFGAGHLGQAIASSDIFADHGFRLVAIFDTDKRKVGQMVGSTKVRHNSELRAIVEEEDIVVGVLAVPTGAAQAIADDLVEAGVKIIFNYAEALLSVPPDVTVHTSSPAVDLLYALYFYLT